MNGSNFIMVFEWKWKPTRVTFLLKIHILRKSNGKFYIEVTFPYVYEKFPLYFRYNYNFAAAQCENVIINNGKPLEDIFSYVEILFMFSFPTQPFIANYKLKPNEND